VHVEIVGGGPRIVLVHGSVAPGWMTWNAQRPLASRFTLVVPVRSGYPPNPPLPRIDFEPQAEELRYLLEPGDHLVAHSYGAVVSLLAAPEAPLASFTVVEPPAFDVARGHDAVEEFLSHFDGRTPREPRAYLSSSCRWSARRSDSPSRYRRLSKRRAPRWPNDRRTRP
jgi:pimeloyl-ACP methyl ester carboxylesterase